MPNARNPGIRFIEIISMKKIKRNRPPQTAGNELKSESKPGQARQMNAGSGESSGGSREGNAGHQSDDGGSQGNR